MLDDLGLVSTSAHISDSSLKYNMDEAIEAANIIGQKYILSPAFMGQTPDEYKAAAELYNIVPLPRDRIEGKYCIMHTQLGTSKAGELLISVNAAFAGVCLTVETHWSLNCGARHLVSRSPELS
jgi:hypothetical protein